MATTTPVARSSHPHLGSARPPARKRTPTVRQRLEWIAERSLLLAAAAAFIGPLVFIVLTSLMTDQQALTSRLWPSPARWSNFHQVFETLPLVRYFANTVLIAVAFTAGVLLTSVPVAYALSRLRWKGRNVAFMVVVGAMFLPAQVTSVPLYVMYSHLHWTGSPLPLIAPAIFDAFSIFLLRQFFVTVPQEYLDAARVDGAGELRTLWYVFLPMVKPALAAVGLFAFFYCWNDFFNPLLYLGEKQEWWTLSLALSEFRTLHNVQWNLAMAATLMFMAPVIVIFFFAQRSFVEGVTLTGVKG